MLTEAEHTTPLGDVRMVMDGEALCALSFVDRWDRTEQALQRRYGRHTRPTLAAHHVSRALDDYFAGRLGAIDDIAIAPRGTAFQAAVWRALRDIPVGQTWSYAMLARAVGRPAAVRAVGAANGANPIWLLVPCHRAIGSDGTLVGYAGGVDRKRWLLAHEARYAMPLLAQQHVEREAHLL